MRWKIAIDGRSAHRPGGGVPNYSIGLIRALGKYADTYDFVFVIEAGAPIEHITFPEHSQFYITSVKKDSRLTRDLWENSILPVTLARMGVHLYHGLDYTIPLIKTPFLKMSTMHDATVFTDYDERHWISKARIRFLLAGIAGSSDAIITDSSFSKNDLLRHLRVAPEKLKVIWSGIDDAYFNPCDKLAETSVKTKMEGCDCYLLYYGGFRKNKNVELLLKACSLIVQKTRAKLVLVGRVGANADKLNERIRQLHLENHVVLFGHASEEELKYLLHNCELLAFPSHMEGFGLPLAEAMACGAPVVCSRAASLPEIGGDAAYYFDPDNPQDCANRILDVLQNNGLRSHLIEKGKERAHLFKWDKSAHLLINLYGTLLGRHFSKGHGN
jgi:glycosyltransferase involved in cell wall biosynthesis